MKRPNYRRKRTLGAWLGIVALSVHVLLAFAQAAPAASSDKNGPLSALQVICPVYGSTGQPPGDGGNGVPARPDCPVCLTHVLCGGLVVPATAIMPLPLRAASDRLTLPALFKIDDVHHERPHSRGPPFAV
ncbi:MAG: hypothetical protein ISR51_05640 [Rhodospirillales bacterium]|nr:hypothetical protein [Alphaproteobacteria bacterium]MBL6948140.1 hypothetical protein [Rhodospirillales bacterium]